MKPIHFYLLIVIAVVAIIIYTAKKSVATSGQKNLNPTNGLKPNRPPQTIRMGDVLESEAVRKSDNRPRNSEFVD